MLFSFHLHMTPLQMMGPPPPYLHTGSNQVDKGLGMIVIPHKPIFPHFQYNTQNHSSAAVLIKQGQLQVKQYHYRHFNNGDNMMMDQWP